MIFLTILNRETLIWNSSVTLIDYVYRPYLPKSIKKVNEGVLIERAHYYTILAEGVRTNREGVLIVEGALTEVLRYIHEVCNVDSCFGEPM